MESDSLVEIDIRGKFEKAGIYLEADVHAHKKLEGPGLFHEMNVVRFNTFLERDNYIKAV